MQAPFKSLIVALVLCLVLGTLPVQSAWADDEITADTQVPDITVLQEQVEAASAVYDEATQRVVGLKKEIELLNARIWEIKTDLPEARKLSNSAAREYYCMLSTSNPFLELVLGAATFSEFIAKLEYSTRLNQSFLDDITCLNKLNEELEAAVAELEEKKIVVEEEQQRAQDALFEAENARSAAEQTARLIAEATAAATAAAAAAAAATVHVPKEPLPPGGGGGAGMPESPSEKQDFVDLWTPRIDAYLAGSPMEGTGIFFANAAFDYNVDPRWSPAIACLESSLGRYCFKPYNAWGWGAASWEDWETAIYAHVRGLSIGYGFTISEAAAKKYCPPNWEHWFNITSGQMAII